MGRNASGKTTLVKHLNGLLLPTRGRVEVDGIDTRKSSIAQLALKVGYVFQNPNDHLFADTVGANILLARPEANDEEVAAAARHALADEFIHDMPKGYDTLLGEGGTTLSGGQAQRIALARAFLAEAPILVLDEPAADLDPRLQTRLDRTLADLLEGRSALIIAHRIPTVLAADRVVVLDNGRVVDQGSHEELLKRCDLYQSLVHSYAGGS